MLIIFVIKKVMSNHVLVNRALGNILISYIQEKYYKQDEWKRHFKHETEVKLSSFTEFI